MCYARYTAISVSNLIKVLHCLLYIMRVLSASFWNEGQKNLHLLWSVWNWWGATTTARCRRHNSLQYFHHRSCTSVFTLCNVPCAAGGNGTLHGPWGPGGPTEPGEHGVLQADWHLLHGPGALGNYVAVWSYWRFVPKHKRHLLSTFLFLALHINTPCRGGAVSSAKTISQSDI